METQEHAGKRTSWPASANNEHCVSCSPILRSHADQTDGVCLVMIERVEKKMNYRRAGVNAIRSSAVKCYRTITLTDAAFRTGVFVFHGGTAPRLTRSRFWIDKERHEAW